MSNMREVKDLKNEGAGTVGQSALTSLEAFLCLVDDKNAALAANQLVIAVTLHQ
jgi:hypothetical protein